MIMISEALIRYRQDSGYPQNASSISAGFNPGISVYTKPLDTSGTFTSVNPTIQQNQMTNPRQVSVSTDATITNYPTFDAKTFIIFLVIVAGVWFLAR